MPGVFTLLTALLGSKNQAIQKNAAGALWDLANNHAANKTLIGQVPGVFTLLTALLR